MQRRVRKAVQEARGGILDYARARDAVGVRPPAGVGKEQAGYRCDCEPKRQAESRSSRPDHGGREQAECASGEQSDRSHFHSSRARAALARGVEQVGYAYEEDRSAERADGERGIAAHGSSDTRRPEDCLSPAPTTVPGWTIGGTLVSASSVGPSVLRSNLAFQ